MDVRVLAGFALCGLVGCSALYGDEFNDLSHKPCSSGSTRSGCVMDSSRASGGVGVAPIHDAGGPARGSGGRVPGDAGDSGGGASSAGRDPGSGGAANQTSSDGGTGSSAGGGGSSAGGAPSGDNDGSSSAGGAPSGGNDGGSSAGGAPSGGNDGGSAAAPSDPDGYVRTGSWHGWTWTQVNAGATITRDSFVKLPVCASGSVPQTADLSSFATLGVNLNQDVGPGTPPAGSVVPTKAGVVVYVSNPAASPLRLEIVGVASGDTWCLDLDGGGGFYPWSSFKSRCWTTGGAAYDGKQSITGLAISVPVNATQPVPFDFCLNSFSEADSGVVGSCSATDALCSPSLIDDFEGQAGLIYSHDGRSGAWYKYNDGSDAGSQTVIEQSSPGYQSQHAIETKGSGFTVWGTGIGVQLNAPPGAKPHAYDASRYAGIHFWYMSSSRVAFRVRTTATTSKDDASVEGGTCTLSVGDCTNFFVPLDPASTWTEVKLPWSSIVQPSWSQIPSAMFDPKVMIELRFESYANDTFDSFIDDVSFL